MKRNFTAFLTAFALMTSVVGFSFAQTNSVGSSIAAATAAPRQINQLAAQLPSSNAVVVLDMQRLMNDALPQLLSAKPQTLGEINAKINEVKTQTGIDLRQFEQLAIGLTFKQTATPGKLDFEPVVLARGKYNAKSLLALAKVASKGKYREEKSGAKTLYIFLAKEIVLSNKPKFKTPKEEEKFNKMLRDVPAEISAAAFDDNTLAIGLPKRVRAAIESKPRVSQDILSLLGQKPNSIMSFSANMPPGASKFFKLDNDELGKNIDAIRQIRGTLDINDGNTLLNIGAKTFQPEQARILEETLAGLQMIGKGFLGGMKGDDKKVYARMVESAKISRAGNEVILDLQVSGSDLSLLLGKK